MDNDQFFMERALKLAEMAAGLGEVPVGTVVVLAGQIIGEGYNRREMTGFATAHAEMLAINDACQKIGSWRLVNACVYSTLEPCIMCSGALLHARVGRLVYGAADEKFGAIESLYRMADDDRLNHKFTCSSSVLAEESKALLKGFFGELRTRRGKN